MKQLNLLLFTLLFGLIPGKNHAQSVSKQGAGVDLVNLKFTVKEAPDWSDMLKRDSGWFGGDGIYTIPLNGVKYKTAAKNDKVLFIFSDSMIGEIDHQQLQPGSVMIHNTVAVLKGSEPIPGNFHFYWKDSVNTPKPVFQPRTPNTKAGDYYWLGDGFVNQETGSDIYIFGYRIHNVSTGAFGFKEVGNTLLKVPAGSKPPFDTVKQMDTPFYLLDAEGNSGSFGAGIFVNTKKAGAPHPDGYIYVYGVRGMAKRLMVARVTPQDFEHFEKWTYWNGKSWDTEIKNVADVTDQVSNELSLTVLPDGRYALIFQVWGMTPTVGLRIGATPYGPFGPIIKLWDCKPDLTKKTFLVYNAKAHPSISKPGELLISYNINSLEFLDDLKIYPHLYRPRFIRVTFDK